jgi:hypothetical protein
MFKGRELGFRLGTGAVAFLTVLIVLAIGWELVRQSQLSIVKFGMGFWIHDIWDPVSGEFGARPFIWGTLYSSVLALLLAGPIALGIAIFLSELCPALAQNAAHLSDRTARGHPVDRLRAVGHLRAGADRSLAGAIDPRVAQSAADLQWSAGRRRDARGGAHSRRHGDPVRCVELRVKC